MGSKIVEKIAKPKPVSYEFEVFTREVKREEILNELRHKLRRKVKHKKISKLLIK